MTKTKKKKKQNSNDVCIKHFQKHKGYSTGNAVSTSCSIQVMLMLLRKHQRYLIMWADSNKTLDSFLCLWVNSFSSNLNKGNKSYSGA